MQLIARGMMWTSPLACACSKEAVKRVETSSGLQGKTGFSSFSKTKQKVRQQALWESSDRHLDGYVSFTTFRSGGLVSFGAADFRARDITAAANLGAVVGTG